MNRPRVLVVEDRPSVLKLFVTVLAERYDVVTASDGGQAVSLLGSLPIDVVLTDVRMPGLSGFDVLRIVRERALPARVVLITAYANIRDAVEAIRLGAFDYLGKPLNVDDIGLVVARAAEHRAGPVAAAPIASPEGDGGPSLDEAFHEAVEAARDKASRDYLDRLMRQFGGNVTEAARLAGMTRESLHRVLRRYSIHSDAYVDPRASPARGRGMP